MDSVVSWLILTIALLAGEGLLFLCRVRYLDSVHITKPACRWANDRRGKDWQAFYTGQYQRVRRL